MDWVDGTDLARLLRERGRPGLAPSSVLAYLAQAAEALTHLHSQDPPVIHGDVKPANLILTKGGRVKLVDFGMSSAPYAQRRRMGTPGFRAPELAADGMPSRASDVYSLAASAFALLSGTAPSGVLPSWEGIDPAQARQLEAALRLGLATDPARRPATPGELVESLRMGWGAALPTGVMTFCLSDIEGSTELWESRSRRDGGGARAPRRDHRRAGGVSGRAVPQVHGRGRFDGLGVRVGAAGARRCRCGHPCPASGAVAGWDTSRGPFRRCTRERPSAAEPTTSARPSTWRRGCEDRPTAARSSYPRRRRRSWPGTCRPIASWSTSVRTGCADSARRRASTP